MEVDTQAAAVEAPVTTDKPVRERDQSGKFVQSPAEKARREAVNSAHDAFFREKAAAEAPMEGILTPALQAQKKEVQPEVGSEKSEPPAGKTESKETVDIQAVEVGLSALKRLKVPAKLIDGMTKAEVAEYGKEAIRQAAERDSLFRENGELRKQVGNTPAKSAESAKAEQPAPDLAADLKLLTETLGDDTGEAIGGLIKKQTAALTAENAALKERLDKIEGHFNADIRTKAADSLVEDAMAELEERFLGLSDKATRKRLVQRILALDDTGSYTDKDELLSHAAKIELEPKPASQPKSSRSTAANPITDTSRSSPRPKTMKDVHAKAYDLAVKKDLPLDQVLAGLR